MSASSPKSSRQTASQPASSTAPMEPTCWCVRAMEPESMSCCPHYHPYPVSGTANLLFAHMLQQYLMPFAEALDAEAKAAKARRTAVFAGAACTQCGSRCCDNTGAHIGGAAACSVCGKWYCDECRDDHLVARKGKGVFKHLLARHKVQSCFGRGWVGLCCGPVTQTI